MSLKNQWPKGVTYWEEGRTLCASVPFTFCLPEIDYKARQIDMFSRWDHIEVGGPAIKLMGDYLSDTPNIVFGGDREGVLQRINPLATRTTLGCTRKCGFCAIGTGRVEGGGMVELGSWANLPIKCDNNFLAASSRHIEKSLLEDIERGSVDYNQGLDARYLTRDIAEMFGAIKKPLVRLSFDTMPVHDQWENAVDMLLDAGVAKTNISTYALVGFRESPAESVKRCEIICKKGVQINPQWYHSMDCLVLNRVSSDQANWGWTEDDRTTVMGYYYRRRGSVAKYLEA